MKKITLTDNQKRIIKELDDPIYTIDYIEEWINREDPLSINAPSALIAMGVNVFYRVVQAIERKEKDFHSPESPFLVHYEDSANSGGWIYCSDESKMKKVIRELSDNHCSIVEAVEIGIIRDIDANSIIQEEK